MLHEEWMTEVVKALGMVAACIGSVPPAEDVLVQSVRDLATLTGHWKSWSEATTRDGQMAVAEAAETSGFFQPAEVERIGA